MDSYGLKTGGGEGQPKERKEKTNGLVWAENRGRGRPTYGKERIRMTRSG